MLIQRIRHIALSTLIAGLVAWPVMAQTFSFDSVTCLNHHTGQAVVGSLQNGNIDCSGLQTQNGDAIGIVLSGIAGDTNTPTPNPTDCQMMNEQEPNDWPEVNELGSLANGGCVTISGEIHTGLGNPQQPNPQADLDDYVVMVAPQGTYQMELSGGALAGVYDGRSGEFFTGCEGSCTFQAPSDVLVVEVIAPQATAYTLKMASGDANQVSGLTFNTMKQQVPSAYGFDGKLRRY